MNEYSKFRESVQEVAPQEARADIAEARVIRESVRNYMKGVLDK